LQKKSFIFGILHHSLFDSLLLAHPSIPLFRSDFLIGVSKIPTLEHIWDLMESYLDMEVLFKAHHNQNNYITTFIGVS